MAEALIGGLLGAKVCRPEGLRATDPSLSRRDVMRSRFGIQVGTDNAETAAWADVVVLAVKPQVSDSVLAELRPGLTEQLLISIAAGIRLVWLRARVPDRVRLIRVMPNAPALVGAGMSVLAPEAGLPADMTALAIRLCRSVGRAEVVEEPMLDAVTGLSGSGPAYVFAALEALADGGVKAGLPRDLAERLAVGTAAGTAHLLLEERPDRALTREDADHVRGPARAGREILHAGGFGAAVADAVVAAARRSQELGA